MIFGACILVSRVKKAGIDKGVQDSEAQALVSKARDLIIGSS